MGERQPTLFSMDFNRSIKVEARPERLTADAGVLLQREVIERLGIIDWMVKRIDDPRNQDLITHPMEELILTSLLLLAQGWRDHDDADTLRDDPAMRLGVSTRSGLSPLESPTRVDGVPTTKNPPDPEGLASQPTLSRLARVLSEGANRAVLHEAIFECAARRILASRRSHRMRYITLDVDSIPVEVHGQQPGSAYNGYYHARVYHPLVCNIAETGDLLGLWLREGNVHTADGAMGAIMPLIDQVEKRIGQVASVRFDAGFPEDEILSALEARRTGYVARIRNNKVLDRMAVPFLKRPVGRRPAESRMWFHEMTYRAESWSTDRRVVLVVQERPGELLLHHFWLLTSWPPEQMPPVALLGLYRQRGTAEGHYGELLNVLRPALSSSPRPKSHYRGHTPVCMYPSGDSFAINEVLLLLNALAYNVAHASRVLLENRTHRGWSLESFRQAVLRVPARIVLHARRAIVVVTEASSRHWLALWSALASFSYAET
ncbi:MAG: IS1380 family transposase [Proteobacteria bacterium]|nr:IS1380 family transposase [Pseudomonadota bacterium]